LSRSDVAGPTERLRRDAKACGGDTKASEAIRIVAKRFERMRCNAGRRIEPSRLRQRACLPYPAVFPPSTVRGGADEFGVILFGIFLQLLRASRNLQSSSRATLTLHLGSRSTESHRLGEFRRARCRYRYDPPTVVERR
jgi:hypothetical protein